VRLAWGAGVSAAAVAALWPSLVFENTYDLPAGEVRKVEVASPRSPQKVRATVTADGAAVGAWLVRQTDAESAEQALKRGEAPTATLAGKEKGAKIALEATVPAGVSYALLVKGNADRKVKVRVRIMARK
jgi:hypothetical protein